MVKHIVVGTLGVVLLCGLMYGAYTGDLLIIGVFTVCLVLLSYTITLPPLE